MGDNYGQAGSMAGNHLFQENDKFKHLVIDMQLKNVLLNIGGRLDLTPKIGSIKTHILTITVLSKTPQKAENYRLRARSRGRLKGVC